MMNATREQFENIWFNPSLPIVEKEALFPGEYEKCLYVNGKLVGSMVVTANGVKYFVEEAL